MGLESGTYVSDLVVTNPVGGDAVSDGDAHIRLLKTTIKNTFPSLTGAVNATQAELNRTVGSGTPITFTPTAGGWFDNGVQLVRVTSALVALTGSIANTTGVGQTMNNLLVGTFVGTLVGGTQYIPCTMFTNVGGVPTGIAGFWLSLVQNGANVELRLYCHDAAMNYLTLPHGGSFIFNGVVRA